MNIDELRQDNAKAHHVEDRTIVTVWIPLSIKKWYKTAGISKSKVLIRFAEEQITTQKNTEETPQENIPAEEPQ